MVANFKILKKPTLLTSFFKLKNKFDNTKRPQIDQQVKKCKKNKTKTKKPQNPKPPNHREDSSMGILTEVIKWLTENFFSYDLTFGQKSDGTFGEYFKFLES